MHWPLRRCGGPTCCELSPAHRQRLVCGLSTTVSYTRKLFIALAPDLLVSRIQTSHSRSLAAGRCRRKLWPIGYETFYGCNLRAFVLSLRVFYSSPFQPSLVYVVSPVVYHRVEHLKCASLG
jgi:hypothetical protein